ncbi:hypothetical protein D3C76_27510 [compost metagenome]
MSELDYQLLQRELDRTKAEVFLNNSTAGFLGSVMCSMEFIWDETIQTAETDGLRLWWNPHWFLSLPPASRKTILYHELWHPGRLHMLRRGSRDPKVWNWACDIRINNDLLREGYTFEDIEWGWMDPEIDKGPKGILAEEEIYELLMANQKQPPPQPTGGGDQPGNGDVGDMREPTNQEIQQVVSNVVMAVQQAKLAGCGGVPGVTQSTLNSFLESIVPWETLLWRFFTDMMDEDYSWKRPNRRYSDMYMPSREEDEGRLEHLAYFIDVSGSVSDADVVRCNSEIRYIKEELKPKKLSLFLFDTRITKEYIFEEDDPFDKLVIVGRGGTSFEPVREKINEIQPTAAVIFSDMDCPPMQPLDYDIPVIWIAVNARQKTVPFGDIIFIRS